MNNSLKHTFIIGMMGSGKTKTAHLLSEKLDTPYIDTDQDLVSILNLNMEEIFDYFSEAETDSIQDALDELGESEFNEEEIRLMRIKFLSEVGN